MLVRIWLILLICAVCPILTQASELEDGIAALEAGNYDTGLQLLLPLAKEGDAKAQNAIGVAYLNGWGVEQDYREATRWLQMSAEQGDARGQASLGITYHYGLGVEQDYGEAIRLYRAAAEQGNTRAQVNLASLLIEGLGAKQDMQEAIRWTRIAAEQGDSMAQLNLGAHYATGRGVPVDWAEALAWYRKAAEQGHAEAQARLGMMYGQGEGVEPDEAESMKWYAMAAEQGHPGAMAKMAANDEPRVGVPPHVREAFALAQSYLSLKGTIEFMLPAAEKGATVHLDGEKITKRNVKRYRRDYKKRLALYAEEIEKRGYENIAGAYVSKAHKSCARIQSTFALLSGGEVSGIEIIQDGFEAKILLKLIDQEQEVSISNSAVVVEQGIVIVDETNTNYYFWGVIDDNNENIIIVPDESVLSTWPQGAAPPKIEDLEECEMILSSIETEMHRAE
jgi:TPR repeat protein